MTSTDDARAFLERVGPFLATEPVLHNVILTLLEQRVDHPEPGRYWSVGVDGEVAGVVFQSPRHYPALVTPMPASLVPVAVDAVVADGVALPGVSGDATTAAAFAGQWTERTKSAAEPTLGQRIYEVDRVEEPGRATGNCRAATSGDRDVVAPWFAAFTAEVGDPARDVDAVVARRIAAGQVRLWDDGGPVAVAAQTAPVAGVVRIGPVFTPPESRGHGYATALVGTMSAAVRSEGLRCILYTDLQNPTSNSIYRALGYRAVAEVLRYRFDAR